MAAPYIDYRQIFERHSLPTEGHAQNGKSVHHWHVMSGFVGLRP